MWLYWGIWVFAIKAVGLMGGLALVQALYARLRVDQVAEMSWRLLVPLGLLQLIVTLWTGA